MLKILKRLGFAAVLALLCGAANSHAATFIQYFSQPGDYIGGGQQRTITTADGPITATGAGGGVDVNFLGLPSFWNLRFRGAAGMPLAAGTYANAERLGSSSAAVLDVSGDGRGCNVLYGHFTVLEVVVGPGDSVTRFAADFEQHCDSAEGALYGGVRFNSDVAYVPQAPAPLPSASLYFVSQPGDYVGGGQSGTIARADADFRLRTNYAAGVQAFVSLYPNLPLFDWMLDFAPAQGQLFGPGTYQSAQRFPFNEAGHPALAVFGQGRGCNTLNGTFTVFELEYGPVETVSKFAADFEQHCEGALPGLYGGIRYNSALPYSPPALPRVRVVGDYTEFALRRSASMSGLQVQALDADSQPIAGATLRFDAACGSFPGGQTAETISDTSGFATIPVFTAPNYSPGTCEVSARIMATPTASASIQVRIFDSSDLVLMALPSDPLITEVGRPFRVGVQVTLHDLPLRNVPVTFYAVSLAVLGAAGPASLTSPATTDSNGVAYADGVAGNDVGGYQIVATTEGAARGIFVEQRGPSVAPPLLAPQVQGMWWSPIENGWGMSVIQHGNKLFAVIYIYDELGKPVWYVMPTGTWNANFTRYAGDLYSPRGTPFFQYDAAKFAPGLPFGSMAITFDNPVNPVNAVIEYSIGGVTGHKLLAPQNFGRSSTVNGSRGDMWWGGVNQNGWGLAILQQGDTLFNVWFTYDAAGSPTWFVMPGGTWTSTGSYDGRIYRTLGSPWVGRQYEPSQLQVFDSGPYRLRFEGDNATLEYSIDGRSGALLLDKQPF